MSDRTFAETQGQAPFDWNKWLDAAIEMLPILPHDGDEKGAMAMAWVTCACGNMCAIIPRRRDSAYSGIDGIPIDPDLKDLGISFSTEIQARNYRAAKLTLRDIEARSAILVAEELKKLNS